ncbi:hypothetical protein K4K49_011798 [Colletotrichum sp. SAR 10_70]|nr:hypothetical protein K4K50_000599 [Colletotrichum sp. SAR 10_71]KAI8202139.1 hypothetical protein K4K49_011798 [Colletotrichum sp. SAR 10_70]KAI8215120.1 hypothetical protein K4K52_010854 [Colletotrichum sp. SAR 10_76]
MEDRRRLFQDIQEADYVMGGTDPKRYEKMSKDGFTKEVWLNNEVYCHGGTQEEIELAEKCFEWIGCLRLFFGDKKAFEYREALASAGLRGPPPDPILTDLRRRATAMVFLLEAAQAGHVTDDILEEEAVRAVTSSQEPDVMEAHWRELRRIHESQWQQKKREEREARNNSISYLDNISGRQEILEQIQEAEYPVQIPITPTTRSSKLEKKYFSKAVWSALWVTPFNSLQDFSRKISRHEIRWFDIRNLFLAITDDLPDVMDIVNNRKYDNPKTPQVASSSNSLRTATPGLSSRLSLASADPPQELSPGSPAMDLQNEPQTPQNPPSPASPTAGKGSIASTKSPLSRNPLGPTTPTKAHERDDYKCRALGTEQNEVAHAYPQKKIELAGVCAQKIECLALLFGQQKIREYQDALRSGYLESPTNLIALDEGVRTMWDQCKITLRVKSFNENEVNLTLHYLHDSELRNRTRAPARYRWENDLTVTPADVLFDLTQQSSVLGESSVSDENTKFSGPADMDLVSTATKQHFQDGSTFKVYAEDPKLRPDPILLDLRDKLAVMASLRGAAGYMDDDDDHGNDSERTRQSAVDEAEDYKSVDGNISDMGEDLYMDDDNYGKYFSPPPSYLRKHTAPTLTIYQLQDTLATILLNFYPDIYLSLAFYEDTQLKLQENPEMSPSNLSRVSEMLRQLQNTFEEESQQAGPRWLLKTYDDLTPEEKSIPDDWLPHLHHCNRMGALDSQKKKEAARQKIWTLVFDGWDTDSPIPEPTSPGESKATDGIVKIGVLDEDAPSSRKRKADGSMAPVPPWRSRGADVFIKVKAHWLRQDLCFPLCDSRGIAFASNISYRKLPGSTLGRLKGECSSRWDSIEVYRGRKANNELVAYWARNKLVISLKNNWRGRADPEAVGLPGSRTTATLEGRPTMEIDQTIDLGKLTYVKLCIDIWEAYHDAASFHMAMNKDYSGVFELSS